MAGGKLSPRQKMINLMYLVLLALLAMQVSVEVMDAFGKMYKRSENSIGQGVDKNKTTLAELRTLSAESPAKYGKTYKIAQEIEKVTKNFTAEINVLKDVIKSANPNDPETGELPASNMGKSDLMNEYLFGGDGNKPEGDKFVAAVDTYKNKMTDLVGNNPSIVNQLNSSFDTQPVKTYDGTTKSWLDYNFKGIPTIGTIAILSSMENAVLNIENESLSSALSGRLKKAASADQLQAFVKLNKNTYSPGDEVVAEVFLASKDATKIPNKVQINNTTINLKNPKNFVDGKVIYRFKAGGVGDRPIVGKFIFKENGKNVPVSINGNYSVVAGSNQAIVSADKMNVVYRGLPNPITITLPGISPTRVKASAPGLTLKRGTSYVMRPGKGKTVAINVVGTTDTGEKITSPPVTFRIKDIPQASATIRGKFGTVSMPKTSLAKSSVNAGLPDFVFDLKLKVTSFKVKVPGKTTVVVNGNRMNNQAQKAISSAKKGDLIAIFGIKATIENNSSYRLKEVAGINVEISN